MKLSVAFWTVYWYTYGLVNNCTTRCIGMTEGSASAIKALFENKRLKIVVFLIHNFCLEMKRNTGQK
jgi:hypothetical protein